jgi:glycosyltransferase involved in cell wall biosynthesis
MGNESTVVLDCRWLTFGGAGRVTELLLAALRDRPPPLSSRWILWGDPAAIAPWAGREAVVVPWHGHPARRFGQADILDVPRADVSVYLHQVRPLRPGRSVTVIYDTIPLHTEPRILPRVAKRLFFTLVGRLSGTVITVSAPSREAIIRDLGVPASRIVVAGLGVDEGRIDRIRAMRAELPLTDAALYVGRFASHKNLERLSRAFAQTAFHASGGRLLLVGGTRDEVGRMTAWLRRFRIEGVEVHGVVSEENLDRWLATSRVLVQPSIAEGYGLPAIEAAAIGIPVASTRAGVASEIPPSLATFMDPFDEESMSAAIDLATSRTDSGERFIPAFTLRDDVVDAVARALEPR